MRLLPSHFPKRFEHRILAAMLALLHVVLWWDFGSGASRSLMLAHIGLFFLWQPLLSHQRRLNWRALTAFSLVPLLFVSALSWLLLGFWLLVLIGLVGGRVNVPRRQRYVYLTALVHLVLEFLIGWVPRMFAIDAPPQDFMDLFRYGLFITPAILFFIPIGPRQHTVRGLPTVDFIYGLTMSMVTLILALGSLVTTYSTNTEYAVALIQSVLAIAIFLLSVAWLWAPMAGFGGLGQLWERYVQNAGTPFEMWLNDLQRTARSSHSPENFLDRALVRLMALQWVTGVQWTDGERSGLIGNTATDNALKSRSGNLRITIHSYRRMGTALTLHAQLLTQMIGHFYRAKESEREFARQAQLRAIYETGARMTHDIKNLLQALRAMTSAVEYAEHSDPDAARALVRRQLPLITQRLQLSLDKLQSPTASTDASEARMQIASEWWRRLTTRNEGQHIKFINQIEMDRPLPAELFDTVAENLIDNARYKRQTETDIDICVRLSIDDERISLQISDNGSQIAEPIKRQLFASALDSANGLGIGLYQAARLAQQMNYRLSLSDRSDLVLFELCSEEKVQPAPL